MSRLACCAGDGGGEKEGHRESGPVGWIRPGEIFNFIQRFSFF
jgi:hypothetical protein